MCIDVLRYGNVLLEKQLCRIDVQKVSFKYRVVDVWNDLQEVYGNAETILSFGKSIDKLWKDVDIKLYAV